MKKLRLSVICFWWLSASFAVLSFSQEPEGFRGIKWGARIEENKMDMTLVEKGKDKNYYLRKGDKLLIGEAELTRIVYGYWNGKFYSVVINSDGAVNKISLISAFRAQFGTPHQPNQFLDQYLWDRGVTTIFLQCTIRDVCSASLFSTTLMNEEQEARKEVAAGAKKDF